MGLFYNAPEPTRGTDVRNGSFREHMSDGGGAGVVDWSGWRCRCEREQRNVQLARSALQQPRRTDRVRRLHPLRRTTLLHLRYDYTPAYSRQQGRLNQWAHWVRAQGPRIFFLFEGPSTGCGEINCLKLIVAINETA